MAVAYMRRIIGYQDRVSLGSLTNADRAFFVAMESVLPVNHSTRTIPARPIDLTRRVPDSAALPTRDFRDYLIELDQAGRDRRQQHRQAAEPAPMVEPEARVYHELTGSWNAHRHGVPSCSAVQVRVGAGAG